MTLSQLRRMLEVSVSRDDLAADYTDWINRGIRSIQRDYSYNCMRSVSNIVMVTGASSVRMPDDFKELQIEDGSVCIKDVDNLIPIRVMTRERMISLTQMPSRNVVPNVFLSNDGDKAFLNLLDTTNIDTTFQIAYFRYLPPLVADSDENYLTREFEDMVQARIKAVAFSVINDPLEAAELAKYKVFKTEAVFFDTRQRTQGRTVQMGG